MKLEIEAGAYDSAADALLGGNTMVAGAYRTLTSKLSGYGAMGGNDTSSEEFVRGYDTSAKEVVSGIADLTNAFGTLAQITDASGKNHRDADAGSDLRGQGTSSGSDGDVAPTQVQAYAPPSSLGGDSGDMPEFWDMIVDHLQGWAWPSADTDRLREAAGTWRTAAGALDRAPAQCEVASAQLGAQRSPEITLATEAIGDIKQGAGDLAAACRDLADCCDEYAEKVDSTKDIIKGLLKDLAIEVGASVALGAVTSFFTFGGGAAVGAAVAASRIVACARKIIEALKAIKAIRAIMRVASIVDKATDVGFLLRRFRNFRKFRKIPTGHLPEHGKPGSFGYDASGKRLPYANNRPSYGDGQVDDVFNNAKNANGDVFVLDKDGNLVKVDWQPGQPRQGVWDMGHRTGQEYRDLREDYLSGKIDKDEFMRRYQDPDRYEPQDPGRNRSHVDEAPRRR